MLFTGFSSKSSLVTQERIAEPEYFGT